MKLKPKKNFTGSQLFVVLLHNWRVMNSPSETEGECLDQDMARSTTPIVQRVSRPFSSSHWQISPSFLFALPRAQAP